MLSTNQQDQAPDCASAAEQQRPVRIRPELLAPAGDRDCARAAVENGADAIYFGLDCGFNARARAHNFSLGALPELMTFLHHRGVRGYVTLNTLAFTGELAELEATIRRVAEAGVDAVLVQDLGVVQLVRSICPDLAIHASTQMTLTSAECIRAVEQFGIERVVLARELSVREIGKIHQRTKMPLEVFVHGALCVAYSGQCLTSESLGGRSANRGQCAQACRLPYELVCDGADIDLGAQQYLLSPQDLAAYDLIAELIDAGVVSFKIEGRLKTPEYVANITHHYRQAIDAATAQRPIEFGAQTIAEMELSFSRGFSHGWLDGCDHKALVPALSSAKRGIRMGEVVAVQGERVRVRLAAAVKRGDGVVLEGNRAADDEQGGRVYEVFLAGQPVTSASPEAIVELAFAYGAIDLHRLRAGQMIWKTDDPELTNRLRRTFTAADPLRRVPVDLQVEAGVGEPLRVFARTATGAECRLDTPEPLAAALRHPLSEDVLRQQLGRLGGSVYELRSIKCRIAGQPMAPLSVLGKLRHELVAALDAAMIVLPKRRIATGVALPTLRRELVSPAAPLDGDCDVGAPVLRVLCRSMVQLRLAIEQGVRKVYADFQDIREHRAATTAAHAAGAEIYLATPRIQKPDEMGIFHVLARHGADGILVRNLSGLRFFAERRIPLVADFSLNATNELTAAVLKQFGAARITASYDLNREQLLDLVAATPPNWLEVVIHQHMPMFHMEHCVFCAVLSPGTNKTNCGRPCDLHQVELRDRLGMLHPLKADVGCRNTLFNAVAQSAAEVVPALLERRVRQFRVELLSDDAAEVRETIATYQDLLAGNVSGQQVWTRLKAANRVGVTRGTLEERRNPLAII